MRAALIALCIAALTACGGYNGGTYLTPIQCLYNGLSQQIYPIPGATNVPDAPGQIVFAFSRLFPSTFQVLIHNDPNPNTATAGTAGFFQQINQSQVPQPSFDQLYQQQPWPPAAPTAPGAGGPYGPGPAGPVGAAAPQMQGVPGQRPVPQPLPAFGGLASWGPIRMRAERARVDSAISRLQIDTRASSELRPDGDGCVLSFSHSFAESEKAARDAAGWEHCFVRFDALLAGQPIGDAESLQTWPATHERYAERFGVDPELGRRTFAEVQAQR